MLAWRGPSQCPLLEFGDSQQCEEKMAIEMDLLYEWARDSVGLNKNGYVCKHEPILW